MATALTKDAANTAQLLSYEWTALDMSMPLPLMLITGGCTATFFGPSQHASGPRKSLAYAGLAFASGLAVGSLGLYLQWLPLLYMGYGTLWGVAAGLAYSPCLHTLMLWSPQRRGLAAGISTACVATGMLGSSLLAKPMLAYFAKPPLFLGSRESVLSQDIDGRLFASVEGHGRGQVEVVELLQEHFPERLLADGLYVAGSGSAGAIETLATIGLGCSAAALVSAYTLRVPHSSTAVDPAPHCDAKETTEKPTLAAQDVSPDSETQYHVLQQAVK